MNKNLFSPRIELLSKNIGKSAYTHMDPRIISEIVGSGRKGAKRNYVMPLAVISFRLKASNFGIETNLLNKNQRSNCLK